MHLITEESVVVKIYRDPIGDVPCMQFTLGGVVYETPLFNVVRQISNDASCRVGANSKITGEGHVECCSVKEMLTRLHGADAVEKLYNTEKE